MLLSSVILCVFRIFITVKKRFRTQIKYVFIVLAILILYLVYETGIHGGDLVKKYGIGLEMEPNVDQK